MEDLVEFLFVEELTLISKHGIEGFYTFKKDEYFNNKAVN